MVAYCSRCKSVNAATGMTTVPIEGMNCSKCVRSSDGELERVGTADPEVVRKHDESVKKRQASHAYKRKRQEYRESEAGKQATQTYNESEAGKQTKQTYFTIS